MKRFVLLIFSVLLLKGSFIAEGQSMYLRTMQPVYSYGVKAGINIASQSSPGNNGVFEVKSITGINFGGYFNYFFTRVLGVQAELAVSVKGSHWKDIYYEKKDILTYIDLPLILRYQPVSLFNIYAGPQISYLTRGMQYDFNRKEKSVIEDLYKPFDLAAVFGVEANLPNKINLTLRVARGLIPVTVSDGYYYKSFNNYIQVTAGYRFEKKMKLQSKTRSNVRRKR